MRCLKAYIGGALTTCKPNGLESGMTCPFPAIKPGCFETYRDYTLKARLCDYETKRGNYAKKTETNQSLLLVCNF